MRRFWLFVRITFAVCVLLALLTRLVEAWTDAWWFESLGLSDLFATMLATRAALFGVGALVFGGAVGLNALIACRVARESALPSLLASHVASGGPSPPLSGGPMPDAPMPDVVEDLAPESVPWPSSASLRPWAIGLVTVLCGWLAGSAASSHWMVWQRFRNSVSLGSPDPFFHLDLGFHLFRLPAWNFAWSFVSWALWASLLLALGIYAWQEAVEWGPRRFWIARGTLRHLCLLGALLLVWRAPGFWLDGMALLSSSRHTLGMSQSDVAWRWPLWRALALAAPLAGAILLWCGWTDRSRAALLTCASWLLLALTLGWAVPTLAGATRAGDAANLERPFVARHADWTRRAFGLDRVARWQESTAPVSLAELRRRGEGLPAWPPESLRALLNRRYAPPGEHWGRVGLDRLSVRGEIRPVFVAMRERIAPSTSWDGAHWDAALGRGMAICDAHRAGADGEPLWYLTPEGRAANGARMTPPRAGLFFGEGRFVPAADAPSWPPAPPPLSGGYALIGGESTPGQGGVALGDGWRRVLLAWRLHDARLLSASPGRSARVLWERDVVERCRRGVPFLAWSDEPLPVLLPSGRVVWLLDALSLSNTFPNAPHQAALGGANSARHIARAVVDAQTGSITLYAADESDPFLPVYRRICPGLIRPAREFPQELRSHLRYPAPLLQMQAALWGRYHGAGDKTPLGDEWTPARALQPGSPPLLLAGPRPISCLLVARAPRSAFYGTQLLVQPPAPGEASAPVVRAMLLAEAAPGSLNPRLIEWRPRQPLTSRALLDPVEAARPRLAFSGPDAVRQATRLSLSHALSVAPMGEALIGVQGRWRSPETVIEGEPNSGETGERLFKTYFVAAPDSSLSGASVEAVAGALALSHRPNHSRPARRPEVVTNPLPAAQAAWQRMQQAKRKGNWTDYGAAERQLGEALSPVPH